MTEIVAYDLAGSGGVRLEAAHKLDDLDASTHRNGNAILRRLLQAQWELIDRVIPHELPPWLPSWPTAGGPSGTSS